MTKAQEVERAESIARLREWLKPGDTVGCILRHVSRSGMQREISLVKLTGEDAGVLALDYNAARVLGDRIGKHDGIVIGGCGMDMGFALVYELSASLYRDGFGCIGEGNGYGTRCPASDHSNGDRDYTAHEARLPCTCLDNPGHTSIGNGAPIHQACEGRGYLIGPAHWHSSGGYALRHRWL